ncbi:hypothetical protein [Clostridium lacusfryxellense]|uniref:hypothetical protein n=1 Tax=Clostridium lacusfryxellense TaxID=205328 RepID=UPI001C0CD68F|nr:hypothetical protein [Clostridium lacusfryxellense]MBU3110845.1 hypothetical protein [Clostridium lacusfryxellense]
MDIFIQILYMFAFAIIVLVIYNVLKIYVLNKIKIGKWIVLGAALLLFIIPMMLWPTMPLFVSRYVIPGITVVLFLWFMDLSGFLKKRNVSNTNTSSSISRKDKKDDIVIRPKAKPNRVKNIKK